jgi:hypothetical protein
MSHKTLLLAGVGRTAGFPTGRGGCCTPINAAYSLVGRTAGFPTGRGGAYRRVL